jgi:O-antigen ligase
LPSSAYFNEIKVFVPTTVFTNPNDLSAIVVLFFPVLYYLADYFKSRSKKRILSIITIAIVILTMSRVAMAMLLVFPLFNLLIKRKLLRFTFISFSLLVIFIIIFNLNFKYLPNESSLYVRNYNRFITLVNIKDNFSNKSSSFNERSQVLLIIWENPAEFIFGKGFRAGAVIIPEKKHIQIVDPHSFFLEVIYNFGYFALIPVALLIFIPVYYSFKYFGRHSLYRLGLIQTFYFVILINVSSSVFRFPLVWVPFAVSYMMIITVNDNILPES